MIKNIEKINDATVRVTYTNTDTVSTFSRLHLETRVTGLRAEIDSLELELDDVKEMLNKLDGEL